MLTDEKRSPRARSFSIASSMRSSMLGRRLGRRGGLGRGDIRESVAVRVRIYIDIASIKIDRLSKSWYTLRLERADRARTERSDDRKPDGLGWLAVRRACRIRDGAGRP